MDSLAPVHVHVSTPRSASRVDNPAALAELKKNNRPQKLKL
jgi:hypothetical protein